MEGAIEGLKATVRASRGKKTTEIPSKQQQEQQKEVASIRNANGFAGSLDGGGPHDKSRLFTVLSEEGKKRHDEEDKTEQ